jgi:multimeric flavodoxin WrbA
MGSPANLLCVHGSPRTDGNTDLLLAVLAQGAEEAGVAVRHIFCRNLEVSPCTGCGGCATTGRCVIRDEMDEVYRAVDEASALALGAPVYFLGLPSQVKRVIDRFQTHWSRVFLLGQALAMEKPGAFVSTAGASQHSVFTCAIRTVEAWFEVSGFQPKLHLLYEGVDEKGAVREHPVALAEARAAGDRLARMALDANPPT